MKPHSHVMPYSLVLASLSAFLITKLCRRDSVLMTIHFFLGDRRHSAILKNIAKPLLPTGIVIALLPKGIVVAPPVPRWRESVGWNAVSIIVRHFLLGVLPTH